MKLKIVGVQNLKIKLMSRFLDAEQILILTFFQSSASVGVLQSYIYIIYVKWGAGCKDKDFSPIYMSASRGRRLLFFSVPLTKYDFFGDDCFFNIFQRLSFFWVQKREDEEMMIIQKKRLLNPKIGWKWRRFQKMKWFVDAILFVLHNFFLLLLLLFLLLFNSLLFNSLLLPRIKDRQCPDVQQQFYDPLSLPDCERLYILVSVSVCRQKMNFKSLEALLLLILWWVKSLFFILLLLLSISTFFLPSFFFFPEAEAIS